MLPAAALLNALRAAAGEVAAGAASALRRRSAG
jgi:hypothetical protein